MTTLKRLDWILIKAELAEGKLSAFERRFIDDMSHRRARLGDRIKLGDRQWEILESISEKAV